MIMLYVGTVIFNTFVIFVNITAINTSGISVLYINTVDYFVFKMLMITEERHTHTQNRNMFLK